MQSFLKQSIESYPVIIEFKEKLPPGVLVTGATATALDLNDRTDASAVVLVSQTLIAQGSPQTQVVFTPRAGTDGHQYQIVVLASISSGVTAAGGSPLREDIIMKVSDLNG